MMLSKDLFYENCWRTCVVRKPVHTTEAFAPSFWLEAKPVANQNAYEVFKCYAIDLGVGGKIIESDSIGFTQEMTISSLQEFLLRKSGIHFEVENG